jgi:hypothetical protein
MNLPRLLIDVSFKSKLNPSEADRNKLLDEARERGFDFVLLPEVRDYRVKFVDHTGTHVGNMFLWFAFWVPSWFVHDEIYNASTQIKIDLIDVYSRKEIIRRFYAGSKEMKLNSFQRGWKFWGVWRVPGSLKEQNWQKITINLMPKALNNIKVDFLKDFKKGIVKAVTEDEYFTKAATKTIVLATGIETYASNTISPIPFAAEDAKTIFRALKANGKAQEGYSVLLTNGMGSKKDILDNLTNLSKRTRISDILVFYFSGYSAALNTENGTEYFLVPYDVLPEKFSETAVSINEIGTVLEENCKAGEVVFILDTSFGSTISGKTFQSEGKVNNKEIAQALGSKAFVFFAGQSKQPANVFLELKSSLLTFFIMEALKKGDANKDGLVSIMEVCTYAKNRVRATSEFRGRTQTPHWEGPTNTRFILQGSDKDNAIKAVFSQLGAESAEEVRMK